MPEEVPVITTAVPLVEYCKVLSKRDRSFFPKSVINIALVKVLDLLLAISN
jgi:hypothetical protein